MTASKNAGDEAVLCQEFPMLGSCGVNFTVPRFVNHYVGIADAPNCAIGSSDMHVATIEVTQPIGRFGSVLWLAESKGLVNTV